MIYNLLHERWIPVLRQDKSREMIRPCDITSNPLNPIVRIDSDRADFNGAYIQFLIALIQTCCAPQKEENLINMPWKEWFNNPPTPKELQEKFIIYERAFTLNGEYPRFMQDKTAEGGLKWELYKILIDGFGASSHFSKYENVNGLSYSTAAIALISHQWNTTNSLAGSKNQHRSSLRNGGFLTTILIPNQVKKEDSDKNIPTLWETVWMNILPQTVLNNYCGNPDKTALKNIFPWMGATRISDKTGRDTFPDDEHPLTMYWATPRRVHFYFTNENGVCSINPNGIEPIVKIFDVKPDGNNYKDWLHPLTPIRKDDKNSPLGFYKTDSGGIRYNHWLGIIQATKSKDSKIYTYPAKIVDYYRTSKSHRIEVVPNCRIAGFGFSNDNAKIDSYRYGEMPIIYVRNECSESFEIIVKQLIDSSTQVIFNLRNSCKALVGIKSYSEKDGRLQWISSIQNSNKESGLIAGSEIIFWNTTEQSFYSLLSQIADILNENKELHEQLKLDWLSVLQKSALEIFDNLAESVSPELQDMCSIVRARQKLVWYLFGTKKKNELKDLLFN